MATVTPVQLKDENGNDLLPITTAHAVKYGDITYGDALDATNANIGDLTTLQTTDKSSLVKSINENTGGLNDIKSKIDNGIVLTPTVSLGMNNVIKKTDNITSYPEFTVKGKDYTNLLGRDGNCEELYKWSPWQCTCVLDSTNKVFGNNGYKLTLTNTGGNIAKTYANIGLVNGKYYLYSVYLKNGNATNIVLNDMAIVTDTTKFTRVGLKFLATDTSPAYIYVGLNGVSGQYGYCDGIMVNEITADDYNLTIDQLLEKYPYGDSYVCLENPLIEVIHDNLIRNGNCEEGVGYWTPINNANIFSVVDGKFRFNNGGGTGAYYRQRVNVKSNTNYFLSGNITNATGTAVVRVMTIDEATEIAYITPGTLQKTFNSGSNNQISVLMQDYVANCGADYDSIMLVEGTTPPASYKSQRIERTVIEGKFAKGDDFDYENGKAVGLRNTKHKVLYGKDYDWQINADGAGIKEISLTNADFCIASSQYKTTFVKYDGSILKNNGDTGSVSTLANQYRNAAYTMCVTIADVDSNWAETLNPNNDEVKAAMDGWKAWYTGQGRYTSFYNIMTTGQSKSDWANNSCALSTVAYATNQTTLTVDDGTIFKAGDMFAVVGYANALTITSVNGNALTVPNIGVSFPAGTRIIRCDNPSSGDLRNLIYCKNNVAPNFDGWQIHYKLTNPEPITDVNTHISGDIPKLDNGDNYLYLDYGMVLGEVIKTYTDANSAYTGVTSIGNTAYTPFNYVKEFGSLYTIYKNGNVDNNWIKINALNGYYQESASLFDTTATYTVDYQILKTMHTSPTSITMSYSQSILNAIGDLAESDNNKQSHDSALDTLIDLSIYEEIKNFRIAGRCFAYSSSDTRLLSQIYYTNKKCIPRITISIINAYYFDGTNIMSTSNIPLSDIQIVIPNVFTNTSPVRISYIGNNATIKSNILNYGMDLVLRATIDCRGRF